jgi:hypothetical protein
METNVPAGPDDGLKAKGGGPTDLTVNDTIAFSPAKFVVTTTVYPPRGAVEATVKPPLNA